MSVNPFACGVLSTTGGGKVFPDDGTYVCASSTDEMFDKYTGEKIGGTYAVKTGPIIKGVRPGSLVHVDGDVFALNTPEGIERLTAAARKLLEERGCVFDLGEQLLRAAPEVKVIAPPKQPWQFPWHRSKRAAKPIMPTKAAPSIPWVFPAQVSRWWQPLW
jgi:hypothetical protein